MVRCGSAAEANLRVSVSKTDLLALFSGSLSPERAVLQKRLQLTRRAKGNAIPAKLPCLPP